MYLEVNFVNTSTFPTGLLDIVSVSYVDMSMLSYLVMLGVDFDDTSTFSDWLSRGCFRFMLILKYSLSLLVKLEVDFIDMSIC